MTDDSKKMPRRDFLSMTWSTMLVLAAGGTGYMGIRFLASQPLDSEANGSITAGLIDDFPLNSITAFEKNKFYLVRREDGGFIALYSKCTHLACAILLDKSEGEFYCPCHGSRFHAEGEVLNPPAPRPLMGFPVSIEDNAVIVDTSQPLSSSDASTIVYPDEEGAAS